jgi:hypothetical protein
MDFVKGKRSWIRVKNKSSPGSHTGFSGKFY